MSILYYLEQENYSNKSTEIKSLDFLFPTNNSFKIIKISNIEENNTFEYIHTYNNSQPSLVVNKYHTFTNDDFMDNLLNYFTISTGYNDDSQPSLVVNKYHTFTNDDFMDNLLNYFTISTGYNDDYIIEIKKLKKNTTYSLIARTMSNIVNNSIIHNINIQSQYNKQIPIKRDIFVGVIYNFTLNKLNNFKLPSNNNFPEPVITNDLKKYIFKESKYKLIMKFRKMNRVIYPKTSIPTNTKLTKRI